MSPPTIYRDVGSKTKWVGAIFSGKMLRETQVYLLSQLYITDLPSIYATLLDRVIGGGGRGGKPCIQWPATFESVCVCGGGGGIPLPLFDMPVYRGIKTLLFMCSRNIITSSSKRYLLLLPSSCTHLFLYIACSQFLSFGLFSSHLHIVTDEGTALKRLVPLSVHFH